MFVVVGYVCKILRVEFEDKGSHRRLASFGGIARLYIVTIALFGKLVKKITMDY